MAAAVVVTAPVWAPAGAAVLAGGGIVIGTGTLVTATAAGLGALSTLAAYDYLSMAEAAGADGDPSVPVIDGSGKVHGKLPKCVPGSWTDEDLEQLAGDLETSIGTRKAATGALGADAEHSRRQGEEERLLRQVRKKLSGS